MWDFDGVLNRAFEGDAFLWQKTFSEDLGLDAKSFTDFMFRPERFGRALVGGVDLLDLLRDWLGPQAARAEEVLAYWLAKDMSPDPEILALAREHGGVIGTNNERHRAAQIARDMRKKAGIDTVFASGVLGVRKPETAFFAAVEQATGLAGGALALVDDQLANVQAAEARGWRGFHFTESSRGGLAAFLRGDA